MNQKQQIILCISIFLVIVSGIFLPYEGEFGLGFSHIILKKDMGYHFLFVPPTGQDVGEFTYRGSRIITARVWVQLVTIVVATLGLLLLFAGKKDKKSSNAEQG